MMIPGRAFAALMCMLFAGACAISPGPEVSRSEMCLFDRYLLEVEYPTRFGANALAEQGVDERSLRDAIREAYQEESANPSVSPSMLFISGGGEDGAFGAGYLDRWAEMRGDGLPAFRVVTGISTGAIISTFAFIGDTRTIVDNYRILDEEEVLHSYVSGGGDLSLSAALAVARRGALADLGPLRERLRENLTEDVFGRVADAQRAGRRLYVGVVDLDTGDAVALDMTAIAVRYETAQAAEERLRIRDCYAEAIVASSSVPMAALPAFIDNRMYIDGGARFGVFSDELGQFIDESRETVRAAGLEPPFFYVIVNSDLEVEHQCGKLDRTICDERPWALEGGREDWRFTGLAGRAVAILINQVYRGSVERIVEQAEAREYEPRVAFIGEEMADYISEVDPSLGSGSKSCREWRLDDMNIDNPVEFHPRYMHCLLNYGAGKAEADNWASDGRR